MDIRVDGRDTGHVALLVGPHDDGGDDRRGLHSAVPSAVDVGGV